MTPARVTRFALLGTRGHAQRVAAPALLASPQAQLLGGVGSTPGGSVTFAKALDLPRSYDGIATPCWQIRRSTPCGSARRGAAGDAGRAIASIEASCANDSPGSRIECYGSSGWLRADDTLSGASVVTRQGAEPEAFEAVGMLDTYRASIADFIAAVHGQPHIGADGQAGIAVAAITEAAMKCGVGAARPVTTHQEVQHEQAR